MIDSINTLVRLIHFLFYFCTMLHLHIACIRHFNISTCLLMLDHTEPETKELTERDQAEDPANTELSQGKP
jgi:hypothetical protein